MPIGIDNASPILDLSEAKSLGYTFVMRYGPPSRYEMSLAECEIIRKQGFGVGLIFEVGGDRALRGASQGTLDGRQHDTWADYCGAPDWLRLVYVAQDAPLTREQLRGPVSDYARAFNLACRRPTMPYGPYEAIEVICGEKGINPYGWQTAGMSGSGSGSGGSFKCNDGSVRRLSKYTAMFQDVKYVLGNRADHNVTFKIPVDWAWGGPYGDPTQPEKEDMSEFVLWWTKPGSSFALKAKVDNTVPQCFKVTANFAQHMGTDRNDPVIEGQRFELQLAGVPKKDDGTSEAEVLVQEDTYFWARSIIYDTVMDGETVIPGSTDDIQGVIRDAVTAAIEAATADISVDASVSPEAVAQIAQATVQLASERLSD